LAWRRRENKTYGVGMVWLLTFSEGAAASVYHTNGVFDYSDPFSISQ
jgi:hypothetical protein